MTNGKVFLCIAGNIGSGKSSLTRLLSEHFHWKAFYEAVDNNPYLSDFYADMKRWAFHLQVFLLSHRFKSHKEIVEMKESVIQDRSIYEDVEIFARNLHEMGNMDQRDYENYKELFSIMVEYLKPPDILIYLRANVDTLLRQIKLRGRPFEQGISREYLERLNGSYEAWISRYNLSKIMIVESDEIDFVNNKDHLLYIINRVETAVRGIHRDSEMLPNLDTIS
ncbi:MAG: deoxynucleoside kinase [Candidatus Kryptoniota bacterium]